MSGKTAEQYKEIGRTALLKVLEERTNHARGNYTALHEHMTTNHANDPEKSPHELMYRMLGELILDLSPLRVVAPKTYERGEVMVMILTALVEETVEPSMCWEDFSNAILAGIDKVHARQLRDIDSEKNAMQLIRLGTELDKGQVDD